VVTKTIESSVVVGTNNQMVLSGNKMHITYFDKTNSRIKLKTNNDLAGTIFSTAIVIINAYNHSPELGIAIDKNGNPGIAYTDWGIGKFQYFSMQPEISASVSTINFSPLASGTSASSILTIANNGSMPLNISGMDLPAAPFSVVGTLGDSIESGQSKALSVSFNPPMPGVAYTGNIRIYSDDPDEATFSININGRSYSNNASLAGLSVGAVTALIDNGDTTYSGTVPFNSTSTTVIPTASEAHAVIKVNGTVVRTGVASPAIPISVGLNHIEVSITSEDGGTVINSTLFITRKDTPEARLSMLRVGEGTIIPAFSPDVENYSLNVENINEVTLMLTALESRSVIKMKGNLVTAGVTTPGISLLDGENLIDIQITAPDNETTNNYTLKVNKAPDLLGLSISNGILNATFDPQQKIYSVTVTNQITAIQITPSGEIGTIILVAGQACTSGKTSELLALQEGNNAITVAAVSADGNAMKYYTINVKRLTGLIGLSIEDAIVNLNSNTYEYLEGVRGVTSASITATVSSGMTIKINGDLVSSGSQSSMISLIEGRNTIHIEVISPECVDTTTYNLVIDRIPLLTNMWINGEVFDLDVERSTYLVNVLDNVDKLTVTAIANPGVTVDLQSNLSSERISTSTWEINLREGSNPFGIWMISADSQVMMQYSFTVNRLPGLDSLFITPGALTPDFDGNLLSYTVQVDRETEAVSLAPVALDPLNLITINGQEISIGITPEAIHLQRGRNDIVVKVTNPSGDVENTYHIYVYRPHASSGTVGYTALTDSGSQLPVAFDQVTGNAQIRIDSEGIWPGGFLE
jgi:hypothetical protein